MYVPGNDISASFFVIVKFVLAYGLNLSMLLSVETYFSKNTYFVATLTVGSMNMSNNSGLSTTPSSSES